MCGIAGAIRPGTASGPELLAAVGRAVAALGHRGPDDSFAAPILRSSAWGMCRLAIRDPAAGRQPFRSNGIEVIFNGEIYNTAELRQRLGGRGWRFDTNCDTEVVLKAYAEFGTASFAQLDGIFALAIVDTAADEVVLARDEFGVKPLFLATRPGAFYFASEPKALRELGCLGDGVDLESLELYLRYGYVPEPRSPWINVRRIAAGTAEVFGAGDAQPRRVEHFRQPGDVDARDDWLEATDAALGESVRRQLVSDRPLGVFLSGGIDSTTVAAYAADAVPGIKAFGVSVPGWKRDERGYMEEAARQLDLDLTIATLSEADFDRLAARVVDVYDEPFADYSAIPMMLVAEVAGAEVRVALSGDGGDELFCGYDRYKAAALADVAARLPTVAANVGDWIMRRRGRGGFERLAAAKDEYGAGGHAYGGLLSVNAHATAAALLGRTPMKHPLAPRSAARATGMAIDIAQYLPADILTKVDRATMAVSLEARVPLLGGPVARLADSMPAAFKSRHRTPKWPLKELLRRRGFSESFVHRPKTGFSFPIDDWLARAIERRSEYQDMVRAPPPPLDRVRTTALLDGLLAGRGGGHQVWMVLVLSAWLTRNP